MSDAPRRSGVPVPPTTDTEKSIAEKEKEALASIAVRNYMLFCFVGLLSMVPLLLLKGMDLWCLFPLILGALSLMAHWRAGPVFVLLSLAILVILRGYRLDPITCIEMGMELTLHRVTGLGPLASTPFLDFLLSLCVLMYVAGHYRLQALVHHIVPPETRSQVPVGVKVKRRTEPFNPRRAPGLLTRWEIPLLAVMMLASAVAAKYVWEYLHQQKPSLGMWAGGWQTLLFTWLCALGLFVAWSAFGYLARSRATPEEAQMYLQDQLWLQTRREQSRISRWLAWAHWRGRRRKEDAR